MQLKINLPIIGPLNCEMNTIQHFALVYFCRLFKIHRNTNIKPGITELPENEFKKLLNELYNYQEMYKSIINNIKEE
jgi:hypothetical protein